MVNSSSCNTKTNITLANVTTAGGPGNRNTPTPTNATLNLTENNCQSCQGVRTNHTNEFNSSSRCANITSVEPSSMPGPACADGWQAFRDSCYFFRLRTEPPRRYGAFSWYGAESYCKQNDSFLAIINSDEEGEFLANALPRPNWRFWIGLSDRKEEGHFVWVNGETHYPRGLIITKKFRNWVHTDSRFFQKSPATPYGVCGLFMPGFGDLWRPTNCELYESAICEKGMNNKFWSDKSNCTSCSHRRFTSRSWDQLDVLSFGNELNIMWIAI